MNIVAAWMEADSLISLLFEGVYFVISAALLLVAFKARNGWVRASLGSLAMSILAWRTLAVIPSWWLYFAEGTLDWGGNGCIALDASCLKQTIKDTVVVIQNAATLGIFIVAFWIYQKKFPAQLGPGESKPETTGGYK